MEKSSIPAKPRRTRIKFLCHFPDAHEVHVAGDFNQWNDKSHPMKKNKSGLWEKVLMLFPGRYEYKFRVDTEWKTDPGNGLKCTNCYGTENSLVIVSRPSERAGKAGRQ